MTRDNAAIVELKQWDKCEDGAGPNEVVTWIGGSRRDTLHPSAQVGQYTMYLEDPHDAFDNETGIQLNRRREANADLLHALPRTEATGRRT